MSKYPVPLSIYSFQHYSSWTLSDNPYNIHTNFFLDLAQKLVSFFLAFSFYFVAFPLYMHVCLLFVWLSASLWMVAHQAALSMGILQARILEWVAMPTSRGSSWPRDWMHVLCFLHWQAGSLPPAPPRNPSSLNGYIQLKFEVKMI